MVSRVAKSAFPYLLPRTRTVLRKMSITRSLLGQDKYMPAIIEGKDCLVAVPTGHGKTLGSMIAACDAILRARERLQRGDRPYPPRFCLEGIKVLFITPLKALNRDLYRRALPQLCKKLDITLAVRHGDTTTHERAKQSRNPPEILVTTPESLQAFLPAPKMGRIHLKGLTLVIIDEVHELVESKRGIQLAVALERLEKVTSLPRLQRVLLSATVGTPSVMFRYFSPHSRDAIIINERVGSRLHVEVYHPTFNPNRDSERLLQPNSTKSLLDVLMTTPDGALRLLKVLEFIKTTRSTLLFTNTRQMAEILGWRLSRLQEIQHPDLPSVAVHHSSLGKDMRITAEESFRHGHLDLMIATSSLELGIDIGHIDLVIQYMSPRRVETLLQRVGRAGHSADEISRGIIIALNPIDALESAVIARMAMKGQLEQTMGYMKGYDVALHQIIGIIRDQGRVSVSELHALLGRATPFSTMTREELLELLEFGAQTRMLNLNAVPNQDPSFWQVSMSRKSLQYYFDNLSTITDTISYVVRDAITGTRVGVLDEKFVSQHGEKGTIFVLSGRAWEITSVDHETNTIEAIETPTVDAAIPTWEGELIPVSYQVAQRVRQYFEQERPNLEALPMDDETRDSIMKFLQEQRQSVPIRKKELTVEVKDRIIVLHTFLGSKANHALGVLLAGLAGQVYRVSVRYVTDAYSVVLELPEPRTYLVLDKLTAVDDDEIEPLLQEFVREDSLYGWKMMQVAKRFGVFRPKNSDLRAIARMLKARYQDTILEKETFNEIFHEKFEIRPIKKLFRLLKEKKMRVQVHYVDEFSPLARSTMDPKVKNVLIMKPDKAILDAVDRRLRRTEMSITCLNPKCDYHAILPVDVLSEEIRCPRCQWKFVAVLHRAEGNVKKIIRKHHRGERLTPDEQKLWRQIQQSASLISTHGKKAAYIMAGRGIGPTVAVRVINALPKDKYQMIEHILRLEREYARNREYWG